MTDEWAIAILVLLLLGPLVSRRVGYYIELYFLILGVFSAGLAGVVRWEVGVKALTQPIVITAAVVAAGFGFRAARTRLDLGFARLRAVVPRPWLAALAVLFISLLSSVITAVVAALILVETTSLLHLEPDRRVKVTVAGCFAIGLGASLTPAGEPLSTLAAHALALGFFGLFGVLAVYVLPGVVGCSLLAGFFARGDYQPGAAILHVDQKPSTIVIEGAKMFGFVAGLVLIGESFKPIATRYVSRLTDDGLFWANIVSAAFDNAALVALELHQMQIERARKAIIALLVSGGILIPGNIPNIVSASLLRIGPLSWAKVGLPLGLALLGIYFAFLRARA